MPFTSSPQSKTSKQGEKDQISEVSSLSKKTNQNNKQIQTCKQQNYYSLYPNSCYALPF